MKTLFAGICLLFASLFSCQQKKAEFRSVSVDDFVAALSHPDVQGLDVRTPAEYSEGHIPGCININVLDEATFATYADSLLEKSRPVALYCRSGKRSKKAADMLTKNGYDVIELSTGFNGWQAAGQAVEK